MTPENFCYWLQGFFEINGEVKSLTPEQIKMIQDHLGYVFNTPKTVQQRQPSIDPSFFKPIQTVQYPWQTPTVTCDTVTFSPGSTTIKDATC